MAGYSARQSSFTTGDTITAAHSNNEFNQILAAFHVSTGHTHDGSTAGDGGPLSTLFSNTISMGTGADTDVAVTFNANSNDGVITWMEDEDYFQFSDDILLSTTEKVQFRDTAIYINSSTDGQLDLVADTEIQIAATTVDINGNVDISGSLTLGGTTITSTGAELNILDGVTATASELNILDGVTATASELNILDGVTATASELNILDGVTSTASELNILDGVTSTATELNLLDGSTAGTVVASKAVVVDSNKDLTGMRNLTIAGDLTISGDDLFMGTNTAGHILVADGTNFNPTAVGDLSEISTVANDDVLLAVDTSGGGLKKITRSTLIAGISAGTEISNVVEDSTPQLGGDLDVNGNALVSTSNGNIALTPNGTGVVRIDGNVDIQTGEIVLKNGGSVSNIKFYCESSNAHYTQLQSSAHSAYGGNVTLTLPAATDTLVGKATTDTLTNKTLTTPVIAEIDSGGDLTLDATTDIILDAGGGDVFFKDDGTTFGSATNTSGNLIIKSGTTTALTFSGANATAAGNLTVTGDLTVNGTTTTVNSTTVTIDDPIFTLGGDSAPGSDDNKDRGIEFRYHTGTAAKVGFFGYDDSASVFTFIPDASNSSEVFSGTAGNVAFGNIAGTLTTAAQTNITSVGALDGGSITSGFGTIDTGSSNITTTGLISGGSLDIDDVLINGTTIGHTDDTDLMTLSNGGLVVAGTLEATGNITGTLATAAQTNITSVGTLTALTVDNIAINGTTIGHTSDTDLMTLASGGLTVAGTIEGTTITASTALVPDASGGADLGSTSLEWGDVYIADDKKLYLGSDQNFSIEYDEDGNDTTAVVAAGGVSMAPHGTSSGNGTELRFQELAANGANYVGFKAPDSIAANKVFVLPNADGTAGQFLKTDGSTNLSWDSAATQISLTAKGTIAAGKPVSLITSGTDSGKGIITSSGVGTTLVKGAVGYPDGESTDYMDSSTDNTTDARTDKMVYGRHSGNVYFLGRRDNRQNVITAGTINASTGAITWGTTVVVSTTSGGIGSLVECKNYSGTTVVVWIGNISTNTQYAVYTVSGTSLSVAKSLTTISTSSIGDEAEVGEAIECVGKAADGYGSGASNNYDPIAFTYHQRNDIFSTQYIYHRFAGFTDSSNVNTLTLGGTQTLANQGADVDDNAHVKGGLSMVWDPDNLLSVVIYAGTFNNGNYKIRQYELTASNFNATERGSETNLDGTEGGYVYADWTYDESINRVIGLVTRDPAESSGNGTLGFIIETNDSGNPTVTKKTASNTGISTPDSNDRTQYVQVAHNSASSTNYSTAFIDSASGASSDKFVMQPITASTTAITGQSYESGTNVEDLVAAGDIADKTANPGDATNVDDFHPSALVAAVNVNMFVFAWRGPVGNNLAPRAMAFGYSTFDYEDQFIGVAQNAVSDGETVNVKSLGQIDTQQSGLTIGSLVYVDSGTSAITATSTDNTEIGRAVSASSFVVTKIFNS